MIRGMHAMFYSTEADCLRVFLRDKLDLSGTDVGGGPRVQVFDGKTHATLQNFFAYESTFRGGARVAGGDLTGSGTAAIIMPISALADSDNLYKPRQANGVAARLREALLAIQERRAPDPFNWTRTLS